MVTMVIWSFGQNRFPCQKNTHYNINIYIFIIIVSQFDKPKIILTKMTLTTLTTYFAAYPSIAGKVIYIKKVKK